MAENRSNPLWNILSSVKLTLIILILLAITSIVGTLIPQQEGAVRFIQGLNPGIARLFSTLQLFDMYHSIWFRLLICLLSLNLIVCSINRFPLTFRLFRLKPKPNRSKPFEDLPPQRTLTTKGEIKEIAEKVTDALKKQYKQIETKETKKGRFVYAEKGRYTLFGVYLVHLSVLFILIGAIIGSAFGFNAYVNILEGEYADTVVLRESMDHRHKKLGFRVYCDKFHVKFYDNGTPREYRSDLSFTVDGEKVHKGALMVNRPITFRGITFYQASYGNSLGNRVRLNIYNSKSDENSLVDVELGKPLPLPGNDGELLLANIRDDFMRMGPAVLVSIRSSEGKETSFWLFKNLEMIIKQFPGMIEKFPKLNPAAYEPYTFRLEDVESRYYTGLQVNRDPGVSLVYIGFLLIMVGLFITFFSSHRRFWIRVTDEAGEIRISVAGKSNKNPVGMDRELDRLALGLGSILNSEGEA